MYGYTNVYPYDTISLCRAKTLVSVSVLKGNSVRRSKGLAWPKIGVRRKFCASSCGHSLTGIKMACSQICSRPQHPGSCVNYPREKRYEPI
ncbi:hypothetical protein ALP04_200004 [Pseudomonas amygdali pv. sesami]|nr:hypothetical protein ALQ69_200046 [Pseudomonas savastanoi pv. glycinea]RMV80878.1 hypothetical protein ALP04_200004 [Pseudomonas amygdali pv. sesami]